MEQTKLLSVTFGCWGGGGTLLHVSTRETIYGGWGGKGGGGHGGRTHEMPEMGLCTGVGGLSVEFHGMSV